MRAWLGRAFPGERRVWWAAAAVWLVLGPFLAYHVLRPKEHQVGGNVAAPKEAAATFRHGSVACQERVPIPDNTGRVQIVIDSPQQLPRVQVTVSSGSQVSRGERFPPTPGPTKTNVAISPVWHTPGDALEGKVCIRIFGKRYATLMGNREIFPDNGPMTLDGKPYARRITLVFLPPYPQRDSLLGLSPEMFHRAALFRPSPIGAWTYWVLFFGLLPAILYLALRAMATAGVRGVGRHMVLLVAALSFGNAAIWALSTPPFDAPDEQAHFAYAEYLARTGHQPEKSGVRPPISSQEANALDGSKTFQYHIELETKPPWTSLDESHWAAARNADKLPTNDGGGVTTASTHAPLYYGVVGVPAYYAGSGGGVFGELTLMRLLSALLSAVIAACVVLTVRELLPRWPVLAVGAGVLVAFEPTFGFISGAFNNDTGVNALAAIVVYLLVRGMRRGLTWRAALALALAIVALPVAKGTGYELYPVAGAGLAVALWRWWRAGHRRDDAFPFGVFVVTAVAAWFGWKLLAPAFNASTFATPGGGSPVGLGTHSFSLFVSYLWQMFFPPLPGMIDIHATYWTAYEVYDKQALAVFGWTQLLMPDWVYKVALYVMYAVGLGGLVALVRHRRALLARAGEAMTVMLVPLSVVAGIAYVLATNPARPVPGEQGRYLFVALVGLAALVAGACTAVGRRWSAAAISALASAMMVLAVASLAFAMSYWYA